MSVFKSAKWRRGRSGESPHYGDIDTASSSHTKGSDKIATPYHHERQLHEKKELDCISHRFRPLYLYLTAAPPAINDQPPRYLATQLPPPPIHSSPKLNPIHFQPAVEYLLQQLSVFSYHRRRRNRDSHTRYEDNLHIHILHILIHIRSAICAPPPSHCGLSSSITYHHRHHRQAS